MTVLTSVRGNCNDVFAPSRPFDEGEPWITSLPIVDTFEGEVIDPQSLHKYLYCEANPIMNVDPTGKSLANLAKLGVKSFLNTIDNMLGAASEWEKSIVGRIPSGFVSAYWESPKWNWEQMNQVGTATEFYDLLIDIKNNRGKITKLVIKGEGFSGGVLDDNDDYYVNVIDKKISTTYGRQTKTINTLLTNITGASSYISLRGCNTDEAAKNIARILNNGTTVTGNVYKSINLPFTDASLTPLWHNYRYKNGKPY
jgi:hypothetical protein